MQKTKTLNQVVATQQKAVRFLRDVVGDPDKADEFEAMTPEDYADHKQILIAENPSSRKSHFTTRRVFMAKPTRADLEDRVAELEQENSELNDRLDSIADIIEPGDSEDEDDDEDEADDESD